MAGVFHFKMLLWQADSAGRACLHLQAKTFNLEFLQGNIQSRTEMGKRRKQAKRRVLQVVIDGQKQWGGVIQIEHAPAARHVG